MAKDNENTQQAQATAQPQQTQTAAKKDNRKEIFIDRGSGNDEPNLIVGFNGKNYVLPRGKTSKVPPEVYDEIMRSRKAQAKLDNRIDELAAQAK